MIRINNRCEIKLSTRYIGISAYFITFLAVLVFLHRFGLRIFFLLIKIYLKATNSNAVPYYVMYRMNVMSLYRTFVLI